MDTFNRTQRIDALVQETIARLIEAEINDPRLKMVTVTGVNVSKDLSIAKIYVITREESQKELMLKLLGKASKFLRHRLAQEVDLRKIPELRFYYDDSIAEGMHIDQLLNQIKED